MSDLRTAAQQALEALKGYRREMACGQPCDAERVLEATLAQQEQPDTDCHAQGVCQRSGYSIGGRKPLMEAEVERKSAAIQRLWKERDALLEFAKYVADIDPGNPAPLFEKARAAIKAVEGEDS